MSKFEREDRYIVIKRIDFEAAKNRLTGKELEDFYYALDMISAVRSQERKKDRLQCVVIESDWPEYEIVWSMLEKRYTEQSS